MTYDEAMESVRQNKLSELGGMRTVARRRAWLADFEKSAEAVCYSWEFEPRIGEDGQIEDKSLGDMPGFALEWHNSDDWNDWGEATTHVHWSPTQEDKIADDWEIMGIYG